MLVNIVRVLIVLAALATLFVTPLFVEGPGGRQILTDGLVVDLIAGAAMVGVTIWWWRARSA